MAMSFYRMFSVAAFVSCVCMVASFVGRVVLDMVDYIASAFTEAIRFFEGWVDLQPATGIPVDRALQNSLRHEAGVSRRSAARNI